MDLLNLAAEVGLNPKRVSSSKRGEYHSPCPSCDGKDRFIIRPEENWYWCRQCKRYGDAIQFCRDFLGMTFKEAKERVGDMDYQPSHPLRFQSDFTQQYHPTCSWIDKAEEFVESCHQRLLLEPEIIADLRTKRGLTLETIRLYRLGWNPITRSDFPSEWGFEEDAARRTFCLPSGFVLPTYDLLGSRNLVRIKIRRPDWKEGDKWPKYHKYYQVIGSSNALALCGYIVNQTAMLVEAEFDAMLVNQETQGFCTCVALGGAGKKPDPTTADWLKSREVILYSLDFDETGDREYSRWASSFPNLGRWRANSHKSPAESFVLGGVDLWKWFLAGREYWLEKQLQAPFSATREFK